MLIGITGAAGCGKSTVAEHLASKYGFLIESFAKPLKDCCAAIFGWRRDLLEGDTPDSRAWRETVDEVVSRRLGMEDVTPRRVLQLFGTDVCRGHLHPEIWIASMEFRIDLRKGHYVIPDVRFVDEAEWIRKNGGIIICLLGPPGRDGAHISELLWKQIVPHYTINNAQQDNTHKLFRIVDTIVDAHISGGCAQE